MAVVCVMTSIRQSEAIGLRWSDVDFKRKSVYVNRGLVLVKNTFHEGPPKTLASERDVPLPEFGWEALLAHRERMRAEGRDVERGPIWVTTNGNPPLRSNLLRKTLRPALKAAGLKSLTWHELRHSCATILIELGVPAEVVARTLGHADVNITLKTYDHAFKKRERLATDAWNHSLAVSDLGVKMGVTQTDPEKKKA